MSKRGRMGDMAGVGCDPDVGDIQEEGILPGISAKEKTAREQIDKLAKFIQDEIPGEPSRSEGAVDTIIRIVGEYKRETNMWRGGKENRAGIHAREG